MSKFGITIIKLFLKSIKCIYNLYNHINNKMSPKINIIFKLLINDRQSEILSYLMYCH